MRAMRTRRVLAYAGRVEKHMTAAELVKKQDHQLRIDRLVQADRRANRRDRLMRYGDNRHHPKGVVKRNSYKWQARKQSSQLVQLLIGVGAVVVAAVVIPHLL